MFDTADQFSGISVLLTSGRQCSCSAECSETTSRCCTVKCNKQCSGKAEVELGDKYSFSIKCKRGKCFLQVFTVHCWHTGRHFTP